MFPTVNKIDVFFYLYVKRKKKYKYSILITQMTISDIQLHCCSVVQRCLLLLQSGELRTCMFDHVTLSEYLNQKNIYVE